MVESLRPASEELDIRTEGAKELNSGLDDMDEKCAGDKICKRIIDDYYSETSSPMGHFKCVGYLQSIIEEYHFDKTIISAQFEYKTHEHGEYVYIAYSREHLWTKNGKRSFSPVITFSPKEKNDCFIRWLKLKSKKFEDYFV